MKKLVTESLDEFLNQQEPITFTTSEGSDTIYLSSDGKWGDSGATITTANSGLTTEGDVVINGNLRINGTLTYGSSEDGPKTGDDLPEDPPIQRK